MRRIGKQLWIVRFPAAALMLLGACDHMQTPMALDAESAFDFTNGPAAPGPFVARVADGLVFFFSADENRDLMSIHFPSDVTFCGGGAPQNRADIQFVTTPSEVQRIIALIEDDDGAVAVYATSDFDEAFGPGGPFSDVPHLCAFMSGPKKIAEGTARRVSVFTSSSFSGNWNGTLTDADGDPVHYAEHHVFVIDQRTGEHTVVTSTITLH